MSKLSRFKKGPAIKLRSGKISRFNDDPEFEDDDFVRRPKKPSHTEENPVKQTTEEPSVSSLSSMSEYFPVQMLKSTRSDNNQTQTAAVSLQDILEENVFCRWGGGKEMSSDTDAMSSVSASSTISSRQQDVVNEDQISLEPVENKQGKVVCPFCWKKLNDKLTGTTHVKTCAKDIPIQQVFEAMQLQEKQIQEWESLGLAFPGFSSGNKKTKNGVPQPAVARRKGTRSRKKTLDDPDLELALALSVSLHEEFESRKVKENLFVIENGLENEIGLIETSKASNSSERKANNVVEKAKKASSQASEMSAPIVPTRRRGKKVKVQDLPLYAVDVEQKKSIISERVAKILEESEMIRMEKVNIRNELPPEALNVPKRLIPLQNRDATLWNLAQYTADVQEDSFTTLEKSTLGVDFSSPLTDSGMDSEGIGHLKSLKSKEIKSESVIAHKESVVSSDVQETSVSRSFNSKLSAKSCSFHSLQNKSVKMMPKVIQDISRMLLNKTQSDIVVYGREEKPLKCHRFMLLARCPKILNEIVEEQSGSRIRYVIPLTNYTHSAVKAFLWYLYTGLVESCNEQTLSELKELGAVFGLEIIEIADNNTDGCIMISSETQTDEILQNSLQGGLDCSSTSEELFKTFDGGSDLLSIQPNCSANSTINSCIDDVGDGKSVDLFESSGSEDESEVNPGQDLEPKEDISLQHIHVAVKELENSDNEDYFEELLTPVSQRAATVTDKKRCRSVSPILDNAMTLYTATQVAGILQARQDGGDVNEFIEKAIKKQKFGSFELLDDHDIISLDVSENIGNSSVLQSTPCTLKDLTDDGKTNPLKISNISLKKRGRSSSTPDLSVIYTQSPKRVSLTRFSTFANKQLKDNREHDPLEDDWDDSVFAKIPDNLFSGNEQEDRVISPSTQENNCEAQYTPSRVKKRMSRKNLASFVDNTDLTFDNKKTNNTNGKPKGKTKSAPKIKLPTRLPKSPENRNKVISQPAPSTTTHLNSAAKSPMLNYSSIDTPILKQELKKYGIKPLPRSKAKVLLRHIYTETHK